MIDDVLYQRIRSQCCEISGLTPKALDKHAARIAEIVTRARNRNQARSHDRQGKRDRAQTKGR